MWHSILNQGFQLETSHKTPFFAKALNIYSSCLAQVSLSYLNHSIGDSHSCLGELIEIVDLIPVDMKPLAHHFYPYHREIGSLLVEITKAAVYLHKAREQTQNWVKELNTFHFPSGIEVILHLYNETQVSLERGIDTQRSFHYMEPEGFYRSLQMCYIPLLQEIWTLQTFLFETSQLFDIPFSLNTGTLPVVTPDTILKLYDKERKRHYPVKSSIWYEKSLTGFQSQTKRFFDLMESKDSPYGQRNMASKLAQFVTWFESEQKFQWRLHQMERSTARFEMIGSCCELLYC